MKLLERAGKHKTVLLYLLSTSVAMFGFGFMLVPLYNAFCDLTGLNGKTKGVYTQTTILPQEQIVGLESSVSNSIASKLTEPEVALRYVDVLFVATNNAGMSWSFKPQKSYMRVAVGKANTVFFLAHNPSQREMTAQAIPSLAPSKALDYFHKTECFCFNQQVLEANSSAELALRFIVDPELPDHIGTITLSYTLFDVTAI